MLLLIKKSVYSKRRRKWTNYNYGSYPSYNTPHQPIVWEIAEMASGSLPYSPSWVITPCGSGVPIGCYACFEPVFDAGFSIVRKCWTQEKVVSVLPLTIILHMLHKLFVLSLLTKRNTYIMGASPRYQQIRNWEYYWYQAIWDPPAARSTGKEKITMWKEELASFCMLTFWTFPRTSLYLTRSEYVTFRSLK